MTKNIAVWVSGGGSNLRALWHYADQLAEQSAYRIAVVCADSVCPALDFAIEKSIPWHVLDPQDRAINKTSTHKISEKLCLENIDIIALSGFMRVLRPRFLADWNHRVVNIHPSLLPKYKGLNTHARALQAGERTHGCSIHYVDTGIDTGILIAQASLAIHASDSADTLAARVLRMEHALYGRTLHKLCSGQLPSRQVMYFTENTLLETQR